MTDAAPGPALADLLTENLVTLMGVERARAQAALLADQAAAHLESFDARADLLRGLAGFVVSRDA